MGLDSVKHQQFFEILDLSDHWLWVAFSDVHSFLSNEVNTTNLSKFHMRIALPLYVFTEGQPNVASGSDPKFLEEKGCVQLPGYRNFLVRS